MLEFLKQPGIYECLWILSGFFACKALYSILGVVHIYRYVKNVSLSCFSLIMITYAGIKKGIDLKRGILIESKTEEYIINNVIHLDQERLNVWKDAALQNLHNFSPIVLKEIYEEFNKE